MQVRILCVDCPLREKKIALLATNAFRITAPTKYLSSIFFEYIVERTDIPPNPTHRKIRFGLYIILVRQRKKIKKKSLKKIEKYCTIFPFIHSRCIQQHYIPEILYVVSILQSSLIALVRKLVKGRHQKLHNAIKFGKNCAIMCVLEIYIVGISVNCTVLSKKILEHCAVMNKHVYNIIR